MTSDELTDKRMSHFVGIGLTLGFLLPHTSTAFLLVNPLLCLFYQCYKQNRVYFKWNWLVLAPVFLTLLINFPQGMATKAVISCLTIMLYFACFPLVGRVKIPSFYFYFILGFVFLSQVAYAFDISLMERILNTYYPISEDDAAAIHQQSTVNADNMLDFRLGGLFHNSNQCARYITFLLAGFLVLNNEKPIHKLVPFIIIAYYAVLLTGSRSGCVVASAIIIVFLFVDSKVSAGWRYATVLLAVAGFAFLVFGGSNTFRGFDLFDTGSTDMKQETFGYYLSSENSIIRILFGYLDVSRFNTSDATSLYVMNKFDSDYGNIIFSYGFIGFFSILLYYFTVFRRMNANGRLFFILLLWMYSSTIVASFRALFLFMLLLSVVYSNDSKSKHLTQ